MTTLRHVENFTLGDVGSVNALTPNQPGEVISPTSYRKLMVDVLREKGGSVYQSELEAEIMWHFAGVWSEDDLKPHGTSQRPRWLNLLDIAKVQSRRRTASPRILARRGERDGESFVLLVLAEPSNDPTHRKRLAWVKKAKPKKAKKGFRKKCPECKALVKVSKKVCPHCNHKFPPPDARQHKLPE